MIRLFTSWFPEDDSQRRHEMLLCLKQNLDNPVIDQVCLFLERTKAPVEHAKLQTLPIDHRPNYLDFFDWANREVQSERDVSLVCNSDICFDRTIAAATQLLNSQTCMALARWDHLDSPDAATDQAAFRLRDRNDSQDTWVFRGLIRHVVADFPVGVPRCDNRILHELRSAGYDVINPARSIGSFHLHAGDRSEYCDENLTHFVDPPYGYLWPHNALSWWSTRRFNRENPDHPLSWRIDRRRIWQSRQLCRLRKILGLPIRLFRKPLVTL